MDLNKNYYSSDYVNNSIIHGLIDQLIDNPNIKVSHGHAGRSITFGGNNYSENDINAAKTNIISRIFTGALLSVKMFCNINGYKEKFDRAIRILNRGNDTSNEFTAEKINAYSSPFLNIPVVPNLNVPNTNLQDMMVQLKSQFANLKSQHNKIKGELDNLNNEFSEIEESKKAFEQKIESLDESKIAERGSGLKKKIILYDQQSKKVSDLKDALVKAQKYLTDKDLSTWDSFHFETAMLTKEDLQKSVGAADELVQLAENELNEIYNEINKELSQFSLEFKNSDLTADNCDAFLKGKFQEEMEKNLIYKSEANDKQLELQRQINEKENSLKEVDGRILEIEKQLKAPEDQEIASEDEASTQSMDSDSQAETNEVKVDHVANTNVEVPLKAEEINEKPAVKKMDLSKELLATGFANTDRVVDMINQQTGSISLANVWARLLGKIGEQFGDIVKSVNIGKRGEITINLIPVVGRSSEEQYRVWIPSTKNSKGIVEPIGGVVIILASKIVIKGTTNNLEVKEGYQNFVRIPENFNWAIPIVGEFSAANTVLMKDMGKNIINITGEKKMPWPMNPIKKDKNAVHDRMDYNFVTRAEVITKNISNEQVIKNHDDNFLADEIV